MTTAGDQIYAILVTPTAARAVSIAISAKQLAEQVDALRDTISTVENGKRMTYAFDVGLSHQVYNELFGPFDAQLRGVKHLIFEPDGAMLRLPANLLVMDQASVDAYKRRSAAGGDASSTPRHPVVRPRPRHQHVGLSSSLRAAAERAAFPGVQRLSRAWREHSAVCRHGSDDSGGRRPRLHPASVVMGRTDLRARAAGCGEDHLRLRSPRRSDRHSRRVHRHEPGARDDLNQYRIIHFATHGVVTARAPKCASQPALLTSFGGTGSDGLLTFREIFDLRLDADLVILSACDTAGKASAAATQQAGLATGGDVALDGLVRAFVGAGGRLVIASHWPVPDDYDATQR